MGISKWVRSENKEEIPFLGISDTLAPPPVIHFDSHEPTIEEF